MDNNINYLWQDRKRILGMPISFTKYAMSVDRLFLQKGLLSLSMDEVILYRVRDISLKLSLWQRMFGVGSILIHSSDKSQPHLELKNIAKPMIVKELIHQQVEEMKVARNMRVGELLDDDNCNDNEG